MCRPSVIPVAALVFAAIPVAAEQSKVIDQRNDRAAEGRYVLFCSHASGTPVGWGFVVLAEGPDPEKAQVKGAYGLVVKDGQPAIATLTPEEVAKVRSVEGDPQPQTLIIRVDQAQYDQAAKLMAEWSKKEYNVDPDIAALDFFTPVIKALGLKEPYRTGLGRPNPQVYLDDLYKLNRGKK